MQKQIIIDGETYSFRPVEGVMLIGIARTTATGRLELTVPDCIARREYLGENNHSCEEETFVVHTKEIVTSRSPFQHILETENLHLSTPGQKSLNGHFQY
jgi:hypothetical protein